MVSVLDSVEGSDWLVDNGTLVLHLRPGTEHYVLDRSGLCHLALPGAPVKGERILHDADQIATSSPAQAWPSIVVWTP